MLRSLALERRVSFHDGSVENQKITPTCLISFYRESYSCFLIIKLKGGMAKVPILSIVLTLLTVGVLSQASLNPILQAQISAFQNWEQAYKVSFSPSEVLYRSLVLNANTKVIQDHNADPTRTYNMVVNKFTAYTEEEFAEIYLGMKPTKGAIRSALDIQIGEESPDEYEDDEDEDEGIGRNLQIAALPEKRVWNRIMTEVKDQGNCGSCWAFCTVALVESMYMKRQKVTLSFSDQEITDCTYKDSYNGCNGGWPTKSFRYIKLNNVSLDQYYPYTAKNQGCQHAKKSAGPNYPIKSRRYIYNDGDCDNLKLQLSKKPLAVAVDATGWQKYGSGVFQCTKKNINHGVLLMGYNQKGQWKIKNSWGKDWGVKGYIWISSGNACAVCDYIWKIGVAKP